MKQTIKFNLKQQSQVIEAMEAYRRRFKGFNQERFDLILDKMKARLTAYDSEELIYIIQALRAYSKLLFFLRKRVDCDDFRLLADYVEKKRIKFQQKHNPLSKFMLAK